MPSKELVDGFLILTAGVLMVTPGFVTDYSGFLLLLPPTRAIVRRLLIGRFRAGRYGRVFTVAGGPVHPLRGFLPGGRRAGCPRVRCLRG